MKPTATTANTNKPMPINIGKGMTIDKEKISQIAIAKQRIF